MKGPSQGEKIMEKSIVYINELLNEIRFKTSSDFSAFACLNKDSFIIQWKFVSGNLNNRYKKMQGRPGKGLAGLAIRADRTMVLDSSIADIASRRLQYPIMLAENLQAAVAVPVRNAGITTGVLLVGSRYNKTYTVAEIQVITEFAGSIGLLPQTS
ncbi:GAF domain-containing protein [Litchfieldia alkalitelluris]|uniref:GAF domain-containing protein n=1 Tax=Litchfieldia alkalitelluris TaxID=304268 RepID=UPI000997F130|nr:GAF domain-containing protein [Litchfieldia alkalitelluris]